MSSLAQSLRAAPTAAADARPRAGAGIRELRAFAAALDAAGWDHLAGRGVAPDERYRLVVEECPVHGAGCARVTFGMFREHVEWARADPAATAAGLLGTMLPAAEVQPPGEPAAE